MTQPSVQSFFSSSAGRTAKFPTIGTSVKGTIVAVHPPEQQTDPQGNVVTWKDGSPKMQIRIELQTDERSPDIEFDDGTRVLYVKSLMQNAVGEALRKAGAREPEVGGKLTVTFTSETPNPGLNPTKNYSAEYVKPSSSSTSEFFGNGAASNVLAGVLVKPDSLPQAAWDSLTPEAKAQVAKTMEDVNSEPPF